MNANVWGPKMWDVLISGAFHLTREDSVDMLAALSEVLPCVHCRRSYSHYVARHPPSACRTADELVQWLWAIKDLVNLKLGKRSTCIPLSTLQTRRAVFTGWLSPFDALDLLAIIALQLETVDQARGYAQLAPHFMSIARISGAPGVSVPPPSVGEPLRVWEHSHALLSATRRAMGYRDLGVADFRAQFELCRAQDGPSSPTRPPQPATPAPRAGGVTVRRLRQLQSRRAR